MVSATILCVGKLKEKFYKEAAAEYLKRLGASCRTEVLELAETPLGADASPAQVEAALEREAEELLSRVPRGAFCVALCVEGDLLSSEDLAALVRRETVAGTSKFVFFIGGSNGLSPRVKRAARVRLSLSRMTFPHHLARVMLLEQLYRAFKINEGSAYHK